MMADQRYHDLDHEHSDHHEHTGEEGVDHQHVDHHEEHKGDGHQLQRTLIEKVSSVTLLILIIVIILHQQF